MNTLNRELIEFVSQHIGGIHGNLHETEKEYLALFLHEIATGDIQEAIESVCLLSGATKEVNKAQNKKW